jgi:hypothetical protein
MSHQIVKATAHILSATRLLASEAEGEGEEAAAPDLKVSGLPKKFWVVTQPTADQELENVAIEMSFADFMDKVKNGLEQSSILGLFKRKGDAHSVAKKALRKVKSEAKEAAEEAEKAAKEQAQAAEVEQEAGEAEEPADTDTQEASGEPGEPGEESVASAALRAVAALKAAVQSRKPVDAGSASDISDAADTLMNAVESYETEMLAVSDAISELVTLLRGAGSKGSGYHKTAQELEDLDPDQGPLESLKALAERLQEIVEDEADREREIADNLMDLKDAVLETLEGSDYEERKDYSGRGMGGKTSPLAYVTGIPPNSTIGKELLDLGLSHDSMGKQYIYYVR